MGGETLRGDVVLVEAPPGLAHVEGADGLAGREALQVVMTFHAACARMLRAEAPRLGYTRQFTIYASPSHDRPTREARTCAKLREHWTRSGASVRTST